MTEFSRADGEQWGDRPVVIVGAGPSLKGFDFNRLNGNWRIVTANESTFDVPRSDAVISIDLPWINNGRAHAAVALGYPVWLGVPEKDPPMHVDVPGAHFLKRSRTFGLSDQPDTVEMGGTSGYAALNFVYHRRPRFVLLLGYDYAAKGANHHYCVERYPHHKPGHNERYWPRWAQNFGEATQQLERAGITVLCASPHSAISAFERCSIDTGMNALQAAAAQG